MLFVTLMKRKPGKTNRETTQRRLEWKYPEGVRVIGEYWLPAGDFDVITITEGDDATLIMHALADWDDLFDARVFPVVTAEEGIAHARRTLAASAA